MKILICGIDGYIGYPLALHLLSRGHTVYGIDNYSRRELVRAAGGNSLTPILGPRERELYLETFHGFPEPIARINLMDYFNTARVLAHFKPDAIVHLAEQPSAPWSMRDARSCINTQENNVTGTLSLLWAMRKNVPNAHLVKLGTMGEYGTPNCDIPEGEIPNQPCAWVKSAESQNDSSPIKLNPKCPMSVLPFPRSPGSFYHLSKVHDTYNIIFACKTWGLRSTDIMQGVVFGVTIKENTKTEELTRFDYDQSFGTVINRFCTQAITGHPLTIYGSGEQTRGYLPLKDSIQCLTLVLENPPSRGVYRTLNQYESIKSVNEIADEVTYQCLKLNIQAGRAHLANPRTEANKHYYNPTNKKLLVLGYKPTKHFHREVLSLLSSILPYRDRINDHVIMPTITWS